MPHNGQGAIGILIRLAIKSSYETKGLSPDFSQKRRKSLTPIIKAGIIMFSIEVIKGPGVNREVAQNQERKGGRNMDKFQIFFSSF